MGTVVTEKQEVTYAPLNRLALWDGNVRKTGITAGIEELEASIQAHGLLQPLVVMNKGKQFTVVAGQRRFIAMHRLADKGVLTKDYQVPCVIVSDADAHEASLAENTVREAMHPADQYAAFNDLAERGLSATEIAARFGVSESTVTKRMKLGRVAPELLELYRAGTIDLEMVQTFTLTDNHKKQMKAWDAARNKNWGQERTVRDILTENEVDNDDSRIQFIGLEAYENAGGKVRRDLFSEDTEFYICDVELLDKLFSEKIETLLQEYRNAGWSWVEFRENFGWGEKGKYDQERGKKPALTIPQKQAKEEIEQEIEELSRLDDMTHDQDSRHDALLERLSEINDRPEVYSKAAMQRCGIVLYFDYNGRFKTELGLKKKEKTKSSNKSDSSDESETKSQFSAKLKEYLETEQSGAIQAELLTNHHVAFSAFVFSTIKDYGGFIGVNFQKKRPVNGSAAEKALENAHDRAEELGMPDPHNYKSDLFNWLLEQTTDTLIALLVPHISHAFNRHLSGTNDLTAALDGINIRKWFTPTTDNYFGRVSANQIIDDLEDMGHSDVLQLKNKKKPELAEIAEKYAANDAPDWVPAPMRFTTDK